MLNKLQSKLIKNQNPTVDYIEEVPEIKVDIEILYKEFLPLQSRTIDQYNSGVLVQKKYALMSQGAFDDAIQVMPYTKQVAEIVSKFCLYNAIYYRFVMPNTCYPWHVDIMKMCVHIPIKSNQGCKFLYSDKIFSLSANGSIYLVNNEKPHTFINAGKNPRLHMTFDIL